MEFTLRWTAQSPDLIGIRWSHRCFSGPGSCFGACPPNNASHQSLNKVICNSDSEIDLRFSKIFLLLDSWRAFRNLLHCRIEAPLSHRLFQTDGGDNYLPVVSNQYGCVCVCVCVCARVPVEEECFDLATPFKSRLHRSVLPVIKSTTVNMLQLHRQNNLSAFSKLSILWRRGNVYYLSFNLREKGSLYHILQKSSVHSWGCSFFPVPLSWLFSIH